jgi:hypothetical protein
MWQALGIFFFGKRVFYEYCVPVGRLTFCEDFRRFPLAGAFLDEGLGIFLSKWLVFQWD